MATHSYENALNAATALSQEEKLRLIEVLTATANTNGELRASILDLCGLGREVWEGIDAQKYVDDERSSWSG